MDTRLSQFRAGPGSSPKGRANSREWVRAQAANNSDYYLWGYSTEEGRTFEMVFGEVAMSRSWNKPMPARGSQSVQVNDLTVTLTRRDDGLIHLKISGRGELQGLHNFRQVAASYLSVGEEGSSGVFRAFVLKIKYWKPQPWHVVTREEAVA